MRIDFMTHARTHTLMTHITVMCVQCLLTCGDAFITVPSQGQMGQRKMGQCRPSSSPRHMAPFALFPFGAAESGQVLKENERGKDNPAPDEYCDDYPRMCYPADGAWHAQLTKVRVAYDVCVCVCDCVCVCVCVCV
jgi:hypothetical protein